MSTLTNFTKHVVLTQAQYNARKAAGTLVAGTIYDISDAPNPTYSGGYAISVVDGVISYDGTKLVANYDSATQTLTLTSN